MSTVKPKQSGLSFETTDAFSWSTFANKLEGFLLTEREFVDGSLVVSLNAPFGSGKTTFLQMWKSDLKSRGESNSDAPMCILLNAWEDDFCGDPLFSLVDALDKETPAQEMNEEGKGSLNSLKEAARDLGWFMAGLANSAVSNWTGVDPVAAGELTEAKKANRDKEPSKPDILALFRERKEALQRLKNALRCLFEGKRPVIILVDELDRCRPDYAIQYLETIKHVFDVDGLVFVLAVDLHQLENSARSLFGGGLNFPEYYRKFAHRNIRLPIPDEAGITKLVTKYIHRYLHDPAPESQGRKSLFDFQNTSNALGNLPLALHLTPRQIQEAFRILGHLTSVYGQKNGDLYYQSANAVIFLTFLSFWRPEQFNELLSGRVSLNRLLEIISELPITKHREWWASVLTLSLDRDLRPQEIQSAFVKHGFVPKETTLEQFEEHLRRYNTGGFGRLSSLEKLAEMIQDLEKFGQ